MSRSFVAALSLAAAPAFAWFAVASGLRLPVATLLTLLWLVGLATLLDSLILRLVGPRRRLARILPQVLIGLPLALAIGILASGFTNDLRLARFSDQLFDFPLPAEATAVERFERVGVLVGNGNHCDFVVELSLSTSVPIPDIRSHYAALRPEPAIPGGAGGGLPQVSVFRPCCEADEPVLVSLVDAPYGSMLDLRCS